MKTKFPLLPLAAFCAALFLASSALVSAQVLARDDAAGYTNAPGGVNTGWYFNTTTNGGFGFTPWVFTKAGANYEGFFIGTGDAVASASNTSWGMYANGPAGDNAAVAFRGFTNSMPTNNVFKLKWHN